MARNWRRDISLWILGCAGLGRDGRRRSNGLWAVREVSRGSTGFRMGAKGRTPLSNEAGPKRAETNKHTRKPDLNRGVGNSHAMCDIVE